MTRNTDIARTFGTPVYIFDADKLDAAARDLTRALPQPSSIYFSLKANPNPAVAEVLRLAGCSAEVSSIGELDAALSAGFPAADIIYTGPGKTDEEIVHAIASGVREFSSESRTDLRRLSALADGLSVEIGILLRVNSDSAPGGAGMRMTGASSQFGIDTGTMPLTRDDIDLPSIEVHGFHFYPLSNASDESALVVEMINSIDTACRLRDELGIELKVLDLGGGFAAPYASSGRRPIYQQLQESIASALDARLPGWRTGETRIVFESGRYLTADSGALVAQIMDVKDSRDRRYVITDTGIHHVGGLSGIGRVLPVSAHVMAGATRGDVTGIETDDDTDTRDIVIAGPLCTPADVLNRNADLADPHPGDLIEIPNVGAYGLSASLMGFLSRPAPAEVLVRGTETISATRIHFDRQDLTMTTHDAQQPADHTPETAWDRNFERHISRAIPRLSIAGGLKADEDLKNAGLDSLALVALLGDLEREYRIAITDDQLTAENFATPDSIWSLVTRARDAVSL
ncbi:phosphopantetheine-binding protein [Rhodococcus sp. H29-C3]|uniref:phosphopantetheine-binding protein n=1 Tax=Rhodococcus sp. H29-C3 TaxID=3046307 RepID=UPI0024BB51AF|nr:phosphopantetheine-binding protein [Rhodococcus sp. H29-C3]MDJ0360823.1 phosphopantetheine-binding protein [Rhodococcus sp. H29-C3]